jgi:cold shock CspA family protein
MLIDQPIGKCYGHDDCMGHQRGREAYGFIRSLDGREIYFHKNSMPAGEFGRLEIGTGVRWVEEEGEKGPQASALRIVDKPGSRTGK